MLSSAARAAVSRRADAGLRTPLPVDVLSCRAVGALLISREVESRWGPELSSAAPDRRRVVWSPDGVEGDPGTVEIVFFSYDLFPDRTVDFLKLAVRCPELRWLHTFSAGVDDPFFRGLLERGIRLSTSSGAQAAPIAQTVMLYLLAHSRDLRGWLRDQAEHAWRPRPIRDLQGLRLGVLGMGPIGLEVARLGQAFGMEALGFRRTPRGDEPCPTRPLGELAAALPCLDYAVLALPLADETRHIIDASALGRMKPDAFLVNVGRGELVDEPALVDALQSGRLAGAALDVFAREPLPPESPLWDSPGVLVTPHSSGTSPGNAVRAFRIFADNLQRYDCSEPLRNEVVRR